MTVMERLCSMDGAAEAGALLRMGFDVQKLRFLAWLIEHDRDPEWVGIKEEDGTHGGH